MASAIYVLRNQGKKVVVDSTQKCWIIFLPIFMFTLTLVAIVSVLLTLRLFANQNQVTLEQQRQQHEPELETIGGHMNSVLVASTDGLVLARLEASIVILEGNHIYSFEISALNGVESKQDADVERNSTSSTSAQQHFNVNFFTPSISIECKFIKNNRTISAS